MSTKTQVLDAVEVIANAVMDIEEAISANAGVVVVKAIKGNTRFKNSSVWILRPSGNYTHVQSGKVTKPERLVGFTEAVYTA